MCRLCLCLFQCVCSNVFVPMYLFQCVCSNVCSNVFVPMCLFQCLFQCVCFNVFVPMPIDLFISSLMSILFPTERNSYKVLFNLLDLVQC